MLEEEEEEPLEDSGGEGLEEELEEKAVASE